MIVKSAIKQYNKIFIGFRHPDIIHKMIEQGYEKPITGEQGFITDQGIFLDRYQAAKHAIECRQIAKTKIDGILFSEDLW